MGNADTTSPLVLFGWLGDRLRRRHTIFLCGLICLLSATAILALGRTIGVLVLGRFLQGLAAAVVWTSGLGLLIDIFGQERYGEAVGYANTAVSVGTTSAPLLGGLAYTRGGYTSVSTMSAATVIFALLLALLMVEPKREYKDSRREAPNGSGQANGDSYANGHAGQNYDATNAQVNINGNDSDSDDPDEYTALISGKITEQRRLQPAYALLLRSGRILAGMGGVFTFSFVMISLEGMIPLFVKDTFHWDSARAALTFLSWILPGFLGPVAGKASDRFGSRWIAVGGLLFAVPPLVLMRLVTHDSDSQKILLCSLLSLVGKLSCRMFNENSSWHKLIQTGEEHPAMWLTQTSAAPDLPPLPHLFTRSMSRLLLAHPNLYLLLLGLGFVWVQPACIADLSTAAGELKRERPRDFGNSGAQSQAFGLFVFSYSCGCLVGPTVAGVLRTKVSWGASTLILACACVAATIPIVSLGPLPLSAYNNKEAIST